MTTNTTTTHVYNSKQNECSSHRSNVLNKRIYDRNIPSQILQPYLSVRPVMTKYSVLPIVDPRAPIKTQMEQMPTYNTTQIFNPGNTVSPWSGFASNINIESQLRNQIYALQKCSKAVYVPDSSSDLYMFSFRSDNQGGAQYQPYPDLFVKETFNTFNPNPENLGTDRFNNCTRQQIRNLTGKNACDY